MFRLVAFLRGINVGGHIVRKDKLVDCFASLGLKSISVYKQSGNVIFEADSVNIGEVAAKIEDKLRAELGYGVPVFIRTIAHLQNVTKQDSFRGQGREGASFLVTFLAEMPAVFPLQLPLTIPRSTAQIISLGNLEVFSVTHGGGEGALPNSFLESKLKMKATTRNINVVKEIVEKYG